MPPRRKRCFRSATQRAARQITTEHHTKAQSTPKKTSKRKYASAMVKNSPMGDVVGLDVLLPSYTPETPEVLLTNLPENQRRSSRISVQRKKAEEVSESRLHNGDEPMFQMDHDNLSTVSEEMDDNCFSTPDEINPSNIDAGSNLPEPIIVDNPRNNETAETPDCVIVGEVIESPAKEALGILPKLSTQSTSLLELQSILSHAGCPRTTFDKVVKVIEEGVIKGAFKKDKRIPRLQSFLNEIRETYPCPDPEEVCVHLETGPQDKDSNHVRAGQFDKAYLIRWEAKQLIKDMLESVLLMGDLDNLVYNPEDPFGKYNPQTDPHANHGEVMSSQWYRDTYDKIITDPSTQILIPIIIYLDKTGTDLKQKYGVEPVAFTIGILRQKIRHLIEAWRVLGYLPDLELSSSAARTASPKNNSSSVSTTT